MPGNPNHLKSYFSLSTFQSSEHGLVSFRIKPFEEELRLRSGRLMACDPYSLDQSTTESTFVQAVPPGSYPVDRCIASTVDDDVLVCLRIRFSPNEPVRWEPAGFQRECDALEPYFGYDTSMGALADKTTASHLRGAEEKIQEIMDVWGACLDLGEDGNALAFPVDPGEGDLRCWWGFDKNEQLAWLALDLGWAHLLGAED
jgi:hypothetical protein